MTTLFEIKDLHATVEGTEILKGVNLQIPAGEVHAVMGPNGSGKSTLSNVIMGHPSYKVTGGDILFEGQSILPMATDERARLGIFLSFQQPVSLTGVEMSSFLRGAVKNTGSFPKFKEYKKELADSLEKLKFKDDFMKRSVNEGFSGGERKKNETLQMMMMKPKLSILDEIDSGLDIDSLKTIATNISDYMKENRSGLVITHYQRLLNYLNIDRIHIFMNGKIVHSGGNELSAKLEESGYDWISEAQAK